MDYGKAFSVIFEDKQWVSKVLIGGLLFMASIVIFPIFFVNGYMIEYTQRVMKGDMSLPEWSDWGEKFRKGFLVFVTLTIYALPAFLFIGLSITFTLLIALLGSAGDSSGQVLAPIAAIIIILGYVLYFAYLLFLYFLIPVVIVRFAQTESVRECLKVKEIFTIAKTHLADVFMLVLFLFVAGVLVNVGTIACFVGAFFTGFYGLLMLHNLYGQFAMKLSEEV